MKIEVILAIGGFVLALGSNAVWALVIFVNAQKKQYAAERDFNHLKNNQKEISNGIALGFDEIDRRFDQVDKEVLEIKAWLIRTIPNAPHSN